jgi:hypothetical protein
MDEGAQCTYGSDTVDASGDAQGPIAPMRGPVVLGVDLAALESAILQYVHLGMGLGQGGRARRGEGTARDASVPELVQRCPFAARAWVYTG